MAKQDFNLKNRPNWKRTNKGAEKLWQDALNWFKGFEKKVKNIDAQKWFEENVYEDWTWEGMLDKFIKKEILGKVG